MKSWYRLQKLHIQMNKHHKVRINLTAIALLMSIPRSKFCNIGRKAH